MSESRLDDNDDLPSCYTGAGEPLKLNVYDLTRMNGYMYWFGLGIYHSAIEAYGVEYAYGAHDYPSSGVFEVEPQQCPGFKFRKSITLGIVWMGAQKFREFVEEIACEYTGDSYHLLYKNCNHFCDDVSIRLVGSAIPCWINRLARLGSFCSCFLPDALQRDTVPTLEYEAFEDDTKSSQSRYRQLAQTLAILAPKRRHLIASSAFLQSSFRGGVSKDWKDSCFTRENLRVL